MPVCAYYFCPARGRFSFKDLQGIFVKGVLFSIEIPQVENIYYENNYVNWRVCRNLFYIQPLFSVSWNAFIYRKNGFCWSISLYKNLIIATDLKIILLNYQNNYVGYIINCMMWNHLDMIVLWLARVGEKDLSRLHCIMIA